MSVPELEPGCAPICYECSCNAQATCYYSGIGCYRLADINCALYDAWQVAEAIARIHDCELRKAVAVAAGDAFDNVLPADCFPYGEFLAACGAHVKAVAG